MNLSVAHVKSFAGGEITPELFGRIDLTKFQTGLALCRNFWILPHGPFQNRHGFYHVNETKNSLKDSVLLPFSYNTQQTFAIEFGEEYIRFHTNGGTLLEPFLDISGITSANPGVVTIADHGFLNGEWVYLDNISGMVEMNGRFVKVTNKSNDTFELADLTGANIDTTSMGAYTLGGRASRVYEIDSPYLEADLHTLRFKQSEDVLSITHENYPPKELRRLSATSWTLADISFVPTIGTPAAPGVVANPASGAISYAYKTTALMADTLEESLPSSATAVNNDLTIAANKNTITPAAVAGAVRYNVYKLFGGLYGYIGQTDGSAFVDNNITPDVSVSPAITSNPFVGATNYPRAVGYYESRRGFGGTLARPQNYWLTRSATEANLSYSIPTQDDDTIQGRVKAGEVNAILHIITTNEWLVLLTSGGPWKLTPSNSDILTPTSALPKQISGEGSSAVQPVNTADEAVYIGESGSRLFAVKYKWEANGLITDDLSLMSPHLFDGYILESITYSKGQKTIWSVRSDGVLIGTTYVPRHEINAMHQHNTLGEFRSVCSVKEGADYPVYAIVKREIGGRTVRFVERMSTVRAKTQSEAYFLDCGLTYRGAPTFVIGGLWHLVGMVVSILADGAVHTPQLVAADGTITLEAAASVVHIGLPYISDCESLPLILEGIAAAGQASLKNVSDVWLRVRESGSILVGPDFDNLRELPARSNENYDTPPRLKNGVVHVVVDNQWEIDARLCVRQPDPLPLTVASMTLAVAVSG